MLREPDIYKALLLVPDRSIEQLESANDYKNKMSEESRVEE